MKFMTISDKTVNDFSTNVRHIPKQDYTCKTTGEQKKKEIEKVVLIMHLICGRSSAADNVYLLYTSRVLHDVSIVIVDDVVVV
jgi:hypothetical protein